MRGRSVDQGQETCQVLGAARPGIVWGEGQIDRGAREDSRTSKAVRAAKKGAGSGITSSPWGGQFFAEPRLAAVHCAELFLTRNYRKGGAAPKGKR